MITSQAFEAEQRKMYGAYGGGRPGRDIASSGTTELTSVCYEYSYPDPNCNTRDKSRGVIYSIRKNVSEHHYEQGVVTTDQGLVYADNMSITPLLFYFAPEAEIGSEV